MKTLRNPFIWLATLLCAASILFSGCAFLKRVTGGSPTVQKQSVNTITTVGETVKFSLDTYLDLVIKGTVTTNSVPVVLKAYGEFQTVYNSSLTLVLGNTNAVPPQILQDAAANFATTVSTAKKDVR